MPEKSPEKNMDAVTANLLEVTLVVKSWGGVKRDPKLERQIRETAGARRQIGHFDKYVISKAAIAKIKTIDGAWRNRFYALTLPWSDTSRVITIGQFEKFCEEMRELGAEREQAVNQFCDNYPKHIEEAKRDLNGEFNPVDYPPIEEVRARFVAEVDYFAVRRGTHLKNSNLARHFQDVLDDRTQEIEDKVSAQLVDALSNLKERVTSKLKHFSDRMHTYGEAPNPAFGKKQRAKETITVGKFKTDTIEGLRDMVEVVAGLNIYDSPVVNEVLVDIKKYLVGTGSAENYTQKLRDDAQLRAKVAKKTDAILEKMAAFEQEA